MAFTIKIKNLKKIQKAYAEYPAKVKGNIIVGISLSSKFIMNKIQSEAPRGKTGNLQKGHEVVVRNGGLTNVIRSRESVPYAIYVHEGTRPHIIRIKRASVLTDGVSFFGKIVHHPGTKANPYMTRSLEMSKGNIERTFNKIFDKMFNI